MGPERWNFAPWNSTHSRLKRSTLRIAGVPEPYNLPWHLAMERGAFAAAGIDLQWHTVPEGSGRMCAMLRDDELDMAVLVTEGPAALAQDDDEAVTDAEEGTAGAGGTETNGSEASGAGE